MSRMPYVFFAFCLKQINEILGIFYIRKLFYLGVYSEVPLKILDFLNNFDEASFHIFNAFFRDSRCDFICLIAETRENIMTCLLVPLS